MVWRAVNSKARHRIVPDNAQVRDPLTRPIARACYLTLCVSGRTYRQSSVDFQTMRSSQEAFGSIFAGDRWAHASPMLPLPCLVSRCGNVAGGS